MTRIEMTRSNNETMTITHIGNEIHMAHTVDGNIVSQIRFTDPDGSQRGQLGEWCRQLQSGGWQGTN